MKDKTQLLIDAHNAIRKRFVLIMIGMAVAMALIFVVGLSVSQYPVSFTEVIGILADYFEGKDTFDNYDQWMKYEIVINMNIPRLICGMAIGAILAISGSIIQVTIRNPMADPYTVGISSGGLLGASLYIAYGFTLIPYLYGTEAIIVNAFIFSLVPTAGIIIVTSLKKDLSPTMMILVGIGIMYIFSASASLIRYTADPTKAAEIYRWSLGSLGKVTYDQLPILILSATVALIAGILLSRYLNVMSQGENISKSLGVNVRRVRIISLVIVALVTASTVALAGTIGFIGLVCPHIARMIVGPNHRHSILCSAMIGMIMLVGCDLISKVIFTYGLPVGAVTALIGSPIFIYLLAKNKKHNW